MKNKSLLPILLLASFALGACTPANSVNPSQPDETSAPAEVSSEEQPVTSEDTVEYGVEIANKAALQGEWYAGTTRDVDVTLSPAANPLTELGKNLTVTSSNPEVVAVTGLGLSALKAGTAKITVKYHEATDTVDVTILDNSAKGKYGVAHEGTAEDPFTNEDALTVAKSEKYEGEVYYVKGKVASFYNAPGSRTDGMVAYFLEPATTGGEKFEIYKCFKEDGSALTDDDIWVGGEATAYGAFTKYNNQYETSSAKFVKCEGNKPQPSKTVEATFAEALAIGAALDDGANTWDSYKFQGYVTLKSGTDYYLTATKGETLTKSKSDAAHGERDVYATAIELYGAGKVEALAAKLLEGAKVEVTMKLKNYHGQVENLASLVDADVEVKEAGTAWAVPEPTVANRTLKEFIDGENTKALAYNVTATIKSWKDDTSAKDQFGNMVLTDGTNDLVIYGASATATALAWDNAGAYSFTNPKDFLTNEITAGLNKGVEITMKLIRADYQGKVQGTGVITAVKEVAATAIALDKTTAEIEIGDNVQLTATLTPANASSKITWTSSDETVATVADGKVVGVKAGTATITAKVSDEIKAECAVTVKASSVVAQEGDFELFTNDIVEGDYVIYYGEKAAKATIASNRLGYAEVKPTSNIITADKASADIVWHFAKSGDNWSIYNADANKYMASTGTKNQAALVDSVTDKATWTVTKGADGTFEIQNVANAAASINSYLRNNGTYGFATYGSSTGGTLSLFKKVGGAAQQEVAQPVGSFSGYAVAADDSNLFVDIAIANEKVFVEVGSVVKVTTTFAFDKATGVVTVNLGDYGTLTATYDEANNKLVNVGIAGAAAAYLKNNNAVELAAAVNYWNLDGTTEELRAQFIRRYRASGASAWTVDNNEEHTDRIVSDTTNFVAGTGAMSVRPYSGSGNAVGLSLKEDFAEAKALKNIGFWIYNSSDKDISLRTWVYTSKGLSGAAEIGGLTAKANGWTYCRMGFDKTIYNFNISNWNGSANALVFDNIVLF